MAELQLPKLIARVRFPSSAPRNGESPEAVVFVVTPPELITMYGAEWCSDCRRTKAQLDGLDIDYRYVDIEQDAAMADEAQRISGRMNIPVVVYPDGSHQVEPANADVESKLRELSLL
jgi:mycoredoxin